MIYLSHKYSLAYLYMTISYCLNGMGTSHITEKYVFFNYSQLEGALSKWTSYQEDVNQFSRWMEKVEASVNASERQYAELREKTAALSKAKVCFICNKPSRSP